MQISIHAPRTGSDSAIESAIDAAKDFNPRSPHGERLALCCDLRHNKKISIHAPRTGSDQEAFDAYKQQVISIHAPRTGSDLSACMSSTKITDFNPRSPHGERLNNAYSTYETVMISIHAPRTGSDSRRATD